MGISSLGQEARALTRAVTTTVHDAPTAGTGFAKLRDAAGMVRVRDAAGRVTNGMPSDPLWHQKTPIYQVYTRTFADGLGTGTGNFKGLTDKLDHLQYMRQKAVWISPHNPSGGKDMGYDITDYNKVSRAFGSRPELVDPVAAAKLPPAELAAYDASLMKDFEGFVDAAHDRGIRVVTEMVMNHTSNKHQWFLDDAAKAAGIVKHQGREAAQKWALTKGDEGPMYVWDFTRTKAEGMPDKWSDVRVIFNDLEEGNWAYDDTAKGWYWHRFFSEQPDLNWDNPRVGTEMKRVVDFWMDKGVDGIRFDAVPYLHQGTREAHGMTYYGENMTATHDVIKDFRRHIDTKYADRITLGEANMDAKATREYFGHGDESNALFDFPTMPRVYEGLLARDKAPILAAQETAKGIPENAAWWRFLRNHDELTLEKVSPETREALWKTFTEGDAARGISADPEARINLGMRVRMADAVGHDDNPALKRKAMEALFSLHYSQSGTPILYNGDEIGQGAIRGKNLVDRERVRNTMQWDASAHHGFSSGNHVSEPIQDAAEGAQLVNVAAQKADPNSLMNRTRDMLLARETSVALQSGATETAVQTSAKELLAFERSTPGERIISMVNLSPERTRSTLDVQVPEGWKVERLHGSRDFDVSKGVPSSVELDPYEYQWLRLTPPEAATTATVGGLPSARGASSAAGLALAGAGVA
ncbi:MAG: trehalose synthase, partial [Thermoleophilia bacterium]|nr:trehalose synthase [Thermoleophilia bacterium]